MKVPFKLGWLKKDKEDPLRPKNQVNKVNYFHLRTGENCKNNKNLLLLSPYLAIPPQSSFDDGRASFLNQSWNHFCSRTGIQYVF